MPLNVLPALPPSNPTGLGSGWRGSSRYKCAWKLNLWLFFFLSTSVSLILISAVTIPNMATGQQLPSSLPAGRPRLHCRPVLALPTFRRPKILPWPARASEGLPPPAELEVGVMSFRKNFKGGVGASLATFHCYPRTPECNAPGARPTDGSPHTARLPPLLTEHVRGRAGQSPAPTSSARARRPSSGFRRRPAGARGVPGPPPPLVRSPRAPPPDPRRRAAWSG